MSTTAPTETITIRLPQAEAQRLRRVAEIAQRSVETVVADTLRANLPPMLDDMPPALRAELAALENLSNAELWAQAQAIYDPSVLAGYDELLSANADGTLDEAGKQTLAELRAKGDRLMFCKAYAALLLKWRGQRVPTVNELA